MFEIKNTKIHKAVESALGRLEALTKRLKIMRVGLNSPKRKVVISSKDLLVSGFSEQTKVVIEPQHGYLKVRLALPGDKNVRTISSRTYKNREGIEPVLDIRHQKIIDLCLGDAEHVHVSFSKEGVIITPTKSKEEQCFAQPKALLLSCDKPNEDGLYSSVVKAISIIKNGNFSEISLDTDSAFEGSREFLLLVLQLRRMGYLFEVADSKLRAWFPNVPKAQKFVTKFIENPKPFNVESRAQINQNFVHEDPFSAFTLCTAGVDVAAMECDGFKNLMVLDYRPHEQRDFKKSKCKITGDTKVTLSDKSDTGAVNAAANSMHTKVVFNEDIYEFNLEQNMKHLKPVNFLHISLSCDDFSCLKNKKDRERSIEKLDTTIDMFFEHLDLIEKMKVPTLLFENVKNFYNSIECKLLMIGLQSLGYVTKKKVLSAIDYNGMTNRERCYLLASTLPQDLDFPNPEPRTKHAWNQVISHNLHNLRDVSHCKSVVKGVETGRIRLVREGDSYTPTYTKSQSRQTKDSVYVYYKGKYFLPNNDLISELMGIGDHFSTPGLSEELRSEVLGQSIEFPMHRKICKGLKEHIQAFIEKCHPKKFALEFEQTEFVF